MVDDWRPTATLDTLRQRAALVAAIRQFFAERGVLEVETPLLGRHAGTDPNLDPVRVNHVLPGAERTHYLQTSPEFAMKRLLAAGSGAIYQLCKAFRAGEAGARHNPEFTMLEWYRPGFDHWQLMDEVEALMQQVLGLREIPRRSYRELFQHHLGIDPHAATTDQLRDLAKRQVEAELGDGHRDLWLDLLFSHCIEPNLGSACFIHDFPASQAALARIEPDAAGVPVARRFELVVAGMEVANGYLELTDADEQRARFQHDNALRRQRGLPEHAVDERLLAAMASGLPACAGVAVGIDRVVMLALGLGRIEEVMAFPLARA